MFYTKRYIEHLESDIAAKAKRITDLEVKYTDLVEKVVFGKEPQTVYEAKLAQFQAQLKDEKPVPQELAPKDALASAEALAVADTVKKHNLKVAEPVK